MSFVSIRADEALNERAREESGVAADHVVRIRLCDDCGRPPYDCYCPHVCEGCGQTINGPARCGDCHGGL